MPLPLVILLGFLGLIIIPFFGCCMTKFTVKNAGKSYAAVGAALIIIGVCLFANMSLSDDANALLIIGALIIALGGGVMALGSFIDKPKKQSTVSKSFVGSPRH
ncbi:MAG: hypothetical protein JWN75_657 [Candidatus Saccharibacteria bacterium]|nr:hypothetical protein [Candidatus Saccharibacteria bacterium]